MNRAILFDLDGTLIDSLPGIAWAANTLLEGEGRPPLPQAQIGSFVGRGELVFLRRLIAAGGLKASDQERLLPPFLELYAKAAERTELFPGVRAALEELKGQGRSLGLVTNKPSGPMTAVLDRLELGAFFDCIVAGDTLDKRKPHPEPLLHCLDTLGAERGLYVGDSEIDAETSGRAGVPFALFTEGIRQAAVEDLAFWRTFDHFDALPGLVAELNDLR